MPTQLFNVSPRAPQCDWRNNTLSTENAFIEQLVDGRGKNLAESQNNATRSNYVLISGDTNRHRQWP